MKIKLSKDWQKCFAWSYMYTTHGSESGMAVLFEFVYRRWNGKVLETMTVKDYDDRGE